MADAKYGRLFTEADVEKLIRAAYEQGWDDRHGGGVGGYDHVMLSTLLVSEEGPWTFPADEPLFLLRGQDILARAAIDEYADGARQVAALSPGGEAHYQAVLAVSDTFGIWAQANPERVKVPD